MYICRVTVVHVIKIALLMGIPIELDMSMIRVLFNLIYVIATEWYVSQ